MWNDEKTLSSLAASKMRFEICFCLINRNLSFYFLYRQIILALFSLTGDDGSTLKNSHVVDTRRVIMLDSSITPKFSILFERLNIFVKNNSS